MSDPGAGFREVRFFVLSAALFGAAFLFLTPPFHVPDEPDHFFRSYQVSEGRWRGETRLGDGRRAAGGHLPASLLAVSELFTADVRFDPDRTIAWRSFRDGFSLPLRPRERRFLDFSATVLYSPTAYAPQALAVLAGRLAGAPPLVLLYLARVFNLAVWIALVAAAIRIIPVFRRGLALLALLPMSLSQAASASADALANGSAFLFIALVLDTAVGPPRTITMKRWLVLGILSAALVLCKPVYAVLPLFIGIIPASKAGSKKRLAAGFALIMIVSLAIPAAWSWASSSTSVPLQPAADARGQISFIRNQPLLFLSILAESFFRNSTIYLREFVGQLGWLDVTLWFPLVVAVFIALWLAVLADGSEDVRISVGQKALSLGIFASGVFLVLSSIYIVWNPVGAPAIEGAQGRYLIPFAPLLFLAAYNRGTWWNLRRLPRLRLGLACLSLCVLAYALMMVVLRFYRL